LVSSLLCLSTVLLYHTLYLHSCSLLFFFFNDTATTEIYTLSLHDALPIYGQIGNDAVGAYQYLQAFTFANNYPFGGRDAAGINPGVLPNPNITWETSEKLDIGLESTLWNG